jgi:hypothetical protein
MELQSNRAGMQRRLQQKDIQIAIAWDGEQVEVI